MNIGANLLGEVRDFIDERDLGREECVGCVFDQFSRATIGNHDRRRVQIERPIKLVHHLTGARIVGADHDAIRMLKVADSSTLAQKFWIGNNREFSAGPFGADYSLDLVAGPDRHRGFRRDHRVFAKRARKLLGCCTDVG